MTRPPTSPALLVGRRLVQLGGALGLLLLTLRPFFDAEVHATAHEWLLSGALIVGGLIGAGWALGCGARVPRATAAAMVVWVLWAFTSCLWSVDRGVSIRASFELLALAAVWWAAVHVGSDERWRRAGMVVLALGLVGTCAHALYQYYYLFEQQRLAAFEQMTQWIGHVAMDRLFSNRVYARFLTPTVLGDYLAVLVPLAVGAAGARWTAPRRGRPLVLSLLAVTAAGVSVWTLALTTARGAWLATVVACVLVLAWQGGRWVWNVRGAAVLLVALVLPVAWPSAAQDVPGATEQKPPIDFVSGMDPAYFAGGLPTLEDLLSSRTLGMRVTYWRGSMGMIRDHPLRGVGWGAWGAAYPRYTVRGGWPTQLAHNNYVQVLAELGPLGLGCFLVVLGTAVWGGLRHVRLAPTHGARWVWLGALGGAVAFAVHSLTDFALYTPAVAWVAFTLFGVLHSVPSGTPPPDIGPRPPIALGLAAAAFALLALWQPVASGARGVRDARALMRDDRSGVAREIATDTMQAAPWDGEAAALAARLIATAAAGGEPPGWDAALAAFERAVRLRPLDPWVRDSYADALWQAGLARRDRGLLQDALRQRRAAVENFPVHPDLHARLAEAADALGLPELAAHERARAAELRPDFRAATERE